VKAGKFSCEQKGRTDQREKGIGVYQPSNTLGKKKKKKRTDKKGRRSNPRPDWGREAAMEVAPKKLRGI